MRESLFVSTKIICDKCNNSGHFSWECYKFNKSNNDINNKTIYELVSIPAIRQHLLFEMSDIKKIISHKWNFENVIDDFIFICFFAGNDFLPRLPSMHIRDGALDILIII